jgi:hypothetical protein
MVSQLLGGMRLGWSETRPTRSGRNAAVGTDSVVYSFYKSSSWKDRRAAGPRDATRQLVGEGDEARDALLAKIDAALEGGTVSPSAVLQLQLRAWLISTRRTVAEGGEVKLTPEQAARVAALAQKAEEDHSRSTLLGALTGGIEGAFARALNAPPSPALPPPDVIEVEAVEVEDVEP